MPSISLDLILAYPLTALLLFLAAVAVLWLCLSAALWAAWVLGYFDFWSNVVRPRLAPLWRKTSELWGLSRTNVRGGESARPTGNARDPGRSGHGWAGDSLHPSNFNGRSAVHTIATPDARDSSAGPRPRSALH